MSKIYPTGSIVQQSSLQLIQNNTSNSQRQPKAICIICNQQSNDLLYLSQCQHKFCQKCLKIYIDTKIQQFKQVKCCQQNCNQLIEIFPQSQQFIYNRLSFDKRKIIKIIHQFYKEMRIKICRGCSDGILNKVYIGNKNKLYCQNCKQYSCIKCCLVEGPQHQCPKLTISLPYGFKQCSNCLNIIQKNKGCDHMICVCGYNFCFDCGQEWISPHVCSNKMIVRSGLSYWLCLIVKMVLFPIVLIVIVFNFVLLSLLICCFSGLTFGCFLWVYLLNLWDERCCESILKLVTIILLPIFLILMVIPGFIWPIINICWRKQLFGNKNHIDQLYSSSLHQIRLYINQ